MDARIPVTRDWKSYAMCLASDAFRSSEIVGRCLDSTNQALLAEAPAIPDHQIVDGTFDPQSKPHRLAAEGLAKMFQEIWPFSR